MSGTAQDVRRLWEDGLLPSEIAVMLRLSTEAVVTCLRFHGIPVRLPSEPLVLLSLSPDD